MSFPWLEVFKKMQVKFKHWIGGWSWGILKLLQALWLSISAPGSLCFQSNFNDIYIFPILKGIVRVKKKVLIKHAKIQRRNALF